MKILQIISGQIVNGALVHCKLLCQQLADRGHDVTLMCRKDSWISNELDTRSIRIVSSELNRWPIRELVNSAKWIRRERFDVIHTHMSRAHTYGILLKCLTGIPVVATAHNRHPQLHWPLNDYVIANSDATRRFHCRVNRVRKSKVNTIHCFIDLASFENVNPLARLGIRREWKFAANRRVIGVVGDVTPRKGHWYLFNALPELIKRFPDLGMVVVGRFHRNEAYVKRLRQFQCKHRMFGRVRWLGRRDNIGEIMSALDVIVVPSIEEPMGMVPLEAMAVGVPVVVSNTGGLVEVVQDQRTGLVIEPRQPAEIVEAVSALLTDELLSSRLVAGGRVSVKENFSPQVLGEQIERALIASSARRQAA